MKKILILHRENLYNLTSDLPIQEVEAEHFKIQIKDFNSASFIAFEEDGLLKILKNDRGACVTIPYASLLMAIEMVTKQEAIRKEFPPDAWEDHSGTEDHPDYVDLSKGKLGIMLPDGGIAPLPLFKFNLPPKPDSKMIIGYDPAHKDQPDPIVGVYIKDPNNPNGPFRQVVSFGDNVTYHKEHEKFLSEVKKTTQYYGHQLQEDYNDEINSAVASAIENQSTYNFGFPESLTEAILYFNDYVPDVTFSAPDFWYAPMFSMYHPETYKQITKECGFWCEDTALYKSLKFTFKCDHEACMINIIIKAIYRFKKFNSLKKS